MTGSTLDEHRDVVAALLPTMPPLDVAISDAHGGMLAANIVAPRDLPEGDVAATDGYAIRAQDASGARPASPVILPVTHDASFDARAVRHHVPGTAVRIPSGAPLPRGADAVARADATDSGVAQVAVSRAPAAGDGVRVQGFDVRAGDTVLRAGTRLAARHIAIAAAMGLSRLPIHPVPRVVVIPVGDELAEPGEQRASGAVAETTGHLVAALIREAGAHAYRVGIVGDDRKALHDAIEDQLVRADVVVTLGGLSGARNDTVADVVTRMGEFRVGTFPLFPGGRHGVGSVLASGRVVPVIGLPGRPVEAAVAFETYVRDALRAMSGHVTGTRATVAATAAQSWSSPAGVVHAVPVLIEEGGSVGATVSPVGDPAAPRLADLAAANGLVLLPADVTEIRQGTVLRCIAWDS